VKEKAHSKEILSVCCNPSGELFMTVTAGADELIKVWDDQFCEKTCIYLRS